MSVTPSAEGIIIAKQSLCYFRKKNQDCHRTLQLHHSFSLLCLGISANWDWAGRCGCGLQQEMLLRVSKNQEVGLPGAWKGEQWEGSCRCPKERSKHTQESLKGHFPSFPYHFQEKKARRKNTQEASPEENSPEWSALPSQGDPSQALLKTGEGFFWAGISQTHSSTFSEFTSSTAPLQNKAVARI